MHANELVVRTSEPPRLRVVQRVREILARREVLLNLVRKELKVKYVSSVLGAAWSLLNPVVFLAVFSFVTAITGLALPEYPIYLLSALLGWNFFTTSAGSTVAASSARIQRYRSSSVEWMPPLPRRYQPGPSASHPFR